MDFPFGERTRHVTYYGVEKEITNRGNTWSVSVSLHFNGHIIVTKTYLKFLLAGIIRTRTVVELKTTFLQLEPTCKVLG